MPIDQPEISKADREINISLTGNAFIMGQPVLMKIIYKNISDKKVAFREPVKDRGVILKIISSDGAFEELPFGRKEHRAIEGGYRYVVEEAEEISLKPDESYEFELDLIERWPEMFPPGRYLVSVMDETDNSEDEITIKSNSLDFRMFVRTESIPVLLQWATSSEKSYDVKKFSVDFIKRFYPEFDLHIDNPNESQLKSNLEMVQKFSSWWESNKNGDEVQRKIGTINESVTNAELPGEESDEQE